MYIILVTKYVAIHVIKCSIILLAIKKTFVQFYKKCVVDFIMLYHKHCKKKIITIKTWFKFGTIISPSYWY